MSIQRQEERSRAIQSDDVNVILPFEAIDRTLLPVAGGKAANLGELTGAGLPVPPGFCITTAAYALVASEAGLDVILDKKAESPADDASLAEAARTCLLAAAMPASVAEAIAGAYRVLGSGEPIPVAVRSSATAEDLPFASFAGQQDTYLNVVGIEAVLEAVQNCWASLWTDRAVSYRASLGIDQRSVQLAVVVQRQIEAEVAGVLFTANPLTGKRRQAVIDANPGLGEAVVSGATNPDHFVVNTASGEIVELPAARSSNGGLVTSGSLFVGPRAVALCELKAVMAAVKPVSPTSKYAPWLNWGRGLRRIMDSPRMPSGPSTPPVIPGCCRHGQLQRFSRCPPPHRQVMMSYASTFRSTSYRGYIDHLPRWRSPPPIS